MRPRDRSRSWGWTLAGVLGSAVLVALLLLPFAALLLRAEPRELWARMGDPAVREALRLSLVTSACATALVVVCGSPLAWALARHEFRGKRALEVLVDLPMLVPPTVAGLALLLAFGRMGLAGDTLAAFGVSLPFTTAAVVLAQAFMATPLFVNAARAGFEGLDDTLLETAATLGAGPARRFVRVVLPLAAPALLAGTAMAAARALGEFGATITFAGNLQGVTRTMPLAVYLALQSDLDLAVLLALVLLVAAALLLFALRMARPFGRGGRDARR
ncbi:MAG: ABC transporter permease [bacterium]